MKKEINCSPAISIVMACLLFMAFGTANATTPSCVKTITTYSMMGKSALRLPNGSYVMESTVIQDTPSQASCDAAGISYLNLKLHDTTGALMFITADYKCAKTEVPLWKTTISCVFE